MSKKIVYTESGNVTIEKVIDGSANPEYTVYDTRNSYCHSKEWHGAVNAAISMGADFKPDMDENNVHWKIQNYSVLSGITLN